MSDGGGLFSSPKAGESKKYGETRKLKNSLRLEHAQSQRPSFRKSEYKDQASIVSGMQDMSLSTQEVGGPQSLHPRSQLQTSKITATQTQVSFFPYKNERKDIIINQKRPTQRYPLNGSNLLISQNSLKLEQDELMDISKRLKQKIKTSTSSPTKCKMIDRSADLLELKSKATSSVAQYINNFQTPFGNDIMGGLNPTKIAQAENSVEFRQVFQGVKKSSHLRSAWKKTAESNSAQGQQPPSKQEGNKSQRNGQQYQEIQLQQNTEKTYGPKAQFTRMHQVLQKRVVFKQHEENSLAQNGQFKEIEIPKEFKDELERSKPKDQLQYLLNLNSDLFINMKNTQKWMTSHRKDQSKFIQSQKNIEFAKDLFRIWDEDGSGNLEVDELTLPLIALGLSSDSSFVMKLLRAIDEEKFHKNKETAKITIRDFSKIFRKDYTSEKVIEVIKKTIFDQREQRRLNFKLLQDQLAAKNLKIGSQTSIEAAAQPISSDRKHKNYTSYESKRATGFANQNGSSKFSFMASRDARGTTAPTSSMFYMNERRKIDSGLSQVEEYSFNNQSNRQQQNQTKFSISQVNTTVGEQNFSELEGKGGEWPLELNHAKTPSLPPSIIPKDSNFNSYVDQGFNPRTSITTTGSPIKSLKNQPRLAKIISQQVDMVGGGASNERKEQKYHSLQQRKKAALVKSMEGEDITLSDQLAVVRSWWQEIDKNRGNLSQKLDDVAKLLVNKKIAAEMETARRVVLQATKKHKQEIDWEDFNQIFCKGIFKEVLISLANKIKQSSASSNANRQAFQTGDSLGGKLNEYQRKLLLEQLGTGLVKDSKELQGENDRPVLYSLSQFMKKNGQLVEDDGMTYNDFLKDPFGYVRKSEEERMKSQFQNDDFVKSIKLHPVQDQKSQKYMKLLDMAQDLLSDFDEQLLNHFNFLNPKMNDQNDRMLVNAKELQQQQKKLLLVSKKVNAKNANNANNTNNKQTLFDGQGSRRVSFKVGSVSEVGEGEESTQRSSKRKAQSNTGGLKYTENKDWNRTKEEAVKIPKEYFEKSGEQRLKEQTDLLRQFQKILDQSSMISKFDL